MKSRNSDYGSYCNSPPDLAGTVVPQDISTEGDTLQNSPLLPTSDEEDSNNDPKHKSDNPLDTVKLDMPPVTSDQEDRYRPEIPGEPLKTFLSALFLGTGFLATTASLAFTHERVPDIKPLPDIVLDNIKYQSWGLDVSEYLLMISTISALIVVLLHSHRVVILRRIWLLLGILYYYRALTMFVTVLPKADETYTCMPRKNDTTTLGKTYTSNIVSNLIFFFQTTLSVC
jgi:shingomyelin synthase